MGSSVKGRGARQAFEPVAACDACTGVMGMSKELLLLVVSRVGAAVPCKVSQGCAHALRCVSWRCWFVGGVQADVGSIYACVADGACSSAVLAFRLV